MSEPPPTLKSARTLSLTYEIPISKRVKFWKGLKEGRFLTTKCKTCGRISFPPTRDCPDCLTTNIEWVQLSGDAQLESFTLITARPTSFANHTPYIVAIGRLKENVKVLAWLAGVDLKDVKIGMELKLKPKVTSRTAEPPMSLQQCKILLH